jgi:hypothetical protein
VYSKAKLKRSDDKTFPCFWPFWTENESHKYLKDSSYCSENSSLFQIGLTSLWIPERFTSCLD